MLTFFDPSKSSITKLIRLLVFQSITQTSPPATITRPRRPFTPSLVPAAVAYGKVPVVCDPEAVLPVLPAAAAEVVPLLADEGKMVPVIVIVDEDEGATGTTVVIVNT